MRLERKTSLAGNSHTIIFNLWFSNLTIGRVDAEEKETELVKILVDMAEV